MCAIRLHRTLLANEKDFVLGDSLSEGFQLSRVKRILLLADKLRGAGLNFQVTNASAIGGTTGAAWNGSRPI